ncbi:MAG TPA: hypothetical protein VK797_00475 [Tepidisphaeraceae bacterium]|jgi:hypothetical protein|nr:hypothetical protein [Tepidisphaeraceae bacterium]
MRTQILVIALAGCGLIVGCEGRPTLFPNSDPALQKTSTQFAADAAKRFPYPGADARNGEAPGRAEIDLMMAQLQILNSGDDDWKEVDVWVNQSYVCHVPLIPRGKLTVKTVAFGMLFDAKGDSFSTQGGKNPVNRIEVARDGKLYTIPMRLAD